MKKDPTVKLKELERPVMNVTVGGGTIMTKYSVALRILLNTAAGPVTPSQPFECLVIDSGQDEFIVGQDILLALGIDVDQQLEQLATRVQADGEATSEVDEDEEAKVSQCGTIEGAIGALIADALANGFPRDREEQLRLIVTKYDVWRLRLGDDPPARVPPLKIRLKKDSVPYRCKARKYPPHIRAFMREFNSELERLGWVYENPSSRWACPALPVKKPGKDEYRQTSDYKPVNALTEPIAGIMPILPVVTENTRGMKFFATFDFIKGFWQLPLSKESQELLSYMTDEKVFTPTRVPQGCSDAALHFQQTMERCFKSLLYK